MKKAYINPEMEIVEIKGQALLTESAYQLKDDGYDPSAESL